MPTRTIKCRFCQGQRNVTLDGQRCGGCGAFVAQAELKPRKRSGAGKLQCPSCGRVTSREIETGRFECKHCLTVFEAPDGEALHHKPDVALERKERDLAMSRDRRWRR